MSDNNDNGLKGGKPHADGVIITDMTKMHGQGFFYESKAGVALMYRTAPLKSPVLTIEQHVNWQSLHLVMEDGTNKPIEDVDDLSKLHHLSAVELTQNWTIAEFEDLLISEARRLDFRVDIFALAFIVDQMRHNEINEPSGYKDRLATGYVNIGDKETNTFVAGVLSAAG